MLSSSKIIKLNKIVLKPIKISIQWNQNLINKNY